MTPSEITMLARELQYSNTRSLIDASVLGSVMLARDLQY